MRAHTGATPTQPHSHASSSSPAPSLGKPSWEKHPGRPSRLQTSSPPGSTPRSEDAPGAGAVPDQSGPPTLPRAREKPHTHTQRGQGGHPAPL